MYSLNSRNILQCHLKTCEFAGIASLTFGWYGIGKSELLKQMYASNPDYHMEYITASEVEPGTLSGVQVADLKRGMSVQLIPEVAKNLNKAESDGKIPVLIIDEFCTAESIVMPTFLELVNAFRVGPHTIPSTTVRHLISNPVEASPDVFNFSPVMGNRLSIANYEGPTALEWIEYEQTTQHHHAACLGFIKDNPEALNQPNALEYTSPTPRSWSRLQAGLNKLPAQAKHFNLSKREFRTARMGLCASLIGEAQTAHLEAYLTYYDELPSIQAIVKSPQKTAIPEKLPPLYMLAMILANKLPTKYAPPALEYLSRWPKEIALVAIRGLVMRDYSLISNQHVADFSDELADLMTEETN